MAKDKYRVGVIGTGMIATSAHLPSWKSIPEVEVVSVMDILPERAQRAAEYFEVPAWYDDYDKMLAEQELDFVSVCTPNVYHKPATLAALRAGAHVCCEKPITTSTANAKEMYDVSDEVGRELFVTQTARFNNATFAAKELVDDGRLGEIYYAETAALRRRGIPKWGVFHMKVHNAGGPVYDIGVHSLDAIMWIMGNPKPTAVSGNTYTKFGNMDEGLATSLADSGAPEGVLTPRPYDYREYDVEDFAAGYIRLADGGAIFLRTSWAANLPDELPKSFILGTEGGLQLGPLEYIYNLGRFQSNVSLKLPRERTDVSFPGHYAALSHAVRVVNGEEEKIVKREQVLKVMSALDGLYESAEKGAEVKVDYEAV